LIAQRDGCARLVEGVLSVEEQLDIKGDLDFKVGNIDFWGAVVIHGSVLDDFHVKATKSVVVEGSVGMATLEAGADLTIKGGVNGARKAKLTCGGTLRSRFLHGARADAGGDISIEVECIDSVLHAGGDIRVVRGGIIGGEARAKGNVEAAVLGSELCVPTILAAGHTGSGAHDPHAAAHLADLDEADELVSKTGAELAKITGSGKSVPAAQRERHAALQGHLAEAQEKAHRVRRELAELSRQHGGTGAVIKAAKAAHPRVSVTVGGVYSQVLASELKGPVTFSADLEKGALKVQARKATDQAVEHVEGESDPAERWRWGPAVLLGGLFVSLLLSWTPAMRLQSEVRPLKVASCEVVDDYAGSARARVKSKAGQTLELGWEELASPQECLAEGTVVEKRRGAFDYTYGGVAFEWPRRGTRLLGPLGVLLSLLLFAAAALGKRLAIQRAAAGPPHQGSG
jgi:hypothetical protein